MHNDNEQHLCHLTLGINTLWEHKQINFFFNSDGLSSIHLGQMCSFQVRKEAKKIPGISGQVGIIWQ